MTSTSRNTALVGLFLSMQVPELQAQEAGDGFSCCNMRTDGSWISDANYAETGKRIIPYGTPVKYLGMAGTVSI